MMLLRRLWPERSVGLLLLLIAALAWPAGYLLKVLSPLEDGRRIEGTITDLAQLAHGLARLSVGIASFKISHCG